MQLHYGGMQQDRGTQLHYYGGMQQDGGMQLHTFQFFELRLSWEMHHKSR